ncbi:MAG: preprotein translocase [Homoserinimonas sp.]|jgi:sec-independent protein translocase protein TatA|nr:preprotein translocase [Homoserinimonas sp.]
MFANLNGWHAVILLVIILLLFGAPKLPALAKSLGQSMKIFKNEVKTPTAENSGTDSSATDGTTGNPVQRPVAPGGSAGDQPSNPQSPLHP